jgi:hypothetical protein
MFVMFGALLVLVVICALVDGAYLETRMWDILFN